MYTIGQLAKKFGISRSTLLYYDSIGLFKPSIRTEANYRKYSDSDLQRLEQICMYRQAGLSLGDIKKILNSPENVNISLLEKQLHLLNDEIRKLRNQQYTIIKILKDDQLLDHIRVINKDTWVALLHSVGIDEITSRRWHMEFERLSPEEHQDFLESLGLPPEKIEEIRKWSASSDNGKDKGECDVD